VSEPRPGSPAAAQLDPRPDPRRALPSVGVLLESLEVAPLLARAPRSLVTEAVRSVVDGARQDPTAAPNDLSGWAAAIGQRLALLERPSLRPVINATGVVLHTNLGRAPLPAAALHAITETAAVACNLEYDLERGERGSRYVHAVALLRELTGAEDAIVVNNCASALVLALNSLAAGREAIVSRGELIEIGGSFRVPDIMAKSGAALVEIGTTNRTRAADFAPAVMEATEGHGVDLIVNTVGGSVFAENVRALAFEGRLATVGYVDGVLHADIDLEALHAKRLTLFGVSNKRRSKEQRAAAVPRFVAEVLPHFAAGRIRPRIDRAFDFAQLPEAKARMEAGAHIGKIVLRLPDVA